MKTELVYAVESMDRVPVLSLVKAKSRKVIESLWIVDKTRVLVAPGASKPGERWLEVGQLEQLGPTAWKITYRTKNEARGLTDVSPLALAQRAYREVMDAYGMPLTSDIKESADAV